VFDFQLLHAAKMSNCSVVRCEPRLRSCYSRRVYRPKRHICVVYAFKKGERSGIHDPAGPTGSWGAGESVARRERKAQEQEFVNEERKLEAEETRAESRSGNHVVGRSTVDRQVAVGSEMQEIADEVADEEYSHMNRLQKWFMELKAALYEWTKSGVEPL
jgi:hypothetical protein